MAFVVLVVAVSVVAVVAFVVLAVVAVVAFVVLCACNIISRDFYPIISFGTLTLI